MLVLSRQGVPRRTVVSGANRWTGRGWTKELECPVCAQTCRILLERADQLACSRCAPRASLHHQLKNTVYWRKLGGEQVARVVRLLSLAQLNSGQLLEAKRALVDVEFAAMSHVEALMPAVLAVVEATDRLLKEN